jgi:predicted membrane-bound spermidine synthase
VAIAAVFFASGAAALIFEVVWFHRAGLVFGNDLWSTSLVLSTYMGGLAIGNGLVIAYGRHLRKLLNAYALIEVTVAVTGVAATHVLPQLTWVLVPLLRQLTFHPQLANGVRGLFAFAVLMLPTTALGATLPVLVAALCRQESRFGYVLGRLYGWNTLGAVAGVLVSETILVPRLGVAGSAWFAAALDLCGAAAVLLIAKRAEAHRPAPASEKDPGRPTSAGPEKPRATVTVTVVNVLAAAFLAGLALMALEVIWFRFLSMFALNTTLTFSLMLAVVLSGIGLGGLAASAWLRRRPLAVVYLPSLAFGAATVSAASYALFASLAGSSSAVHWYNVLWIAGCLTAATSFASGSIFTVLGQALRGSAAPDTSAAAWLTLFNTSGAMCGSLAATFVLLPVLGIERSTFALTALYCALGVATLRRPVAWTTMARRVTAVALLAALLALLGFPFGSMAGKHVVRAASKYMSDGSEIVATREGRSETIFLLENRWLGKPLYHRLVTNGFSMASTRLTDERYMRYFVYWPMLMHGSPIRRALVVCYGVGVTVSAVTELPSIESIDVAEISPDIVAMSDRIYPPDQSPLADPRVHLHIADGRQFLITTDRQFDLITGEPPPPLTPGAANLYTREYFQLMRNRLAEGGIASYWLPVADGAVHGVSSIIRAFCEVFEDCSLWSGTLFDWVLIGTRGARGPGSDAAFARAWNDPTIGSRLRSVLFELPQQFGATFIGDAAYLKSLAAATPPLTDNFPRRVLADSPAPLFGDPRHAEAMTAYVSALDPARARAAFQQSPFIRRLWPPSLLEETLPLFEQRALINAVMAGPATPLRYIADLDELLTKTNLRMLPLWVLGSNKVVQDVASTGDDGTGLVEYQLGVRLIVARSYRAAANYFAAAERRGLRAAWLRPLRIYALCLAGEVEAAERLVPNAEEEDEDSHRFWSWMEARFGLGARSGASAR